MAPGEVFSPQIVAATLLSALKSMEEPIVTSRYASSFAGAVVVNSSSVQVSALSEGFHPLWGAGGLKARP